MEIKENEIASEQIKMLKKEISRLVWKNTKLKAEISIMKERYDEELNKKEDESTFWFRKYSVLKDKIEETKKIQEENNL